MSQIDAMAKQLDAAYAEIAKLRAALENMLIHGGCCQGTPCADCQNARAALEGGERDSQ
jgi:uncharacterized protein (DUF779 family)